MPRTRSRPTPPTPTRTRTRRRRRTSNAAPRASTRPRARVASEETPKLGITSARRNVFAAGDRDAGLEPPPRAPSPAAGWETFSRRSRASSRASSSARRNSRTRPSRWSRRRPRRRRSSRRGPGSNPSACASDSVPPRPSSPRARVSPRSPPTRDPRRASMPTPPRPRVVRQREEGGGEEIRRLESSAYAFLSAASRCLASVEISRENSARTAREPRGKSWRTPTRPRLTKRSAHGFSPAGSLVAANSARAAPSTSARSASSSQAKAARPIEVEPKDVKSRSRTQSRMNRPARTLRAPPACRTAAPTPILLRDGRADPPRRRARVEARDRVEAR